MKWVGKINLGSCPDWSELEEAKASLEKMGATAIQARINERAHSYGYSNIVVVCGYK